jgi:hypothetical protein
MNLDTTLDSSPGERDGKEMQGDETRASRS